ncbi:hypothetical protein [Roseiflexus sp.]|uniref:hypothetical protein n=1 Tax=Roseiflexus sp. TaxID=2562120 RepID=UPI00398AF458
MNGVLKTAFLVGIAIAVETLLLRRLFNDVSWGIFLGVFLIASILLVALQYVASRRHSMRTARQRLRQESSPEIWSGLDPPSVPTTHHTDGANHNSAPQSEQMADSALHDEDGIINKESS